MIRFDGRVALVTGAGGGLGRGYAKCFAERGARVVVNDLGVDLHGEPGSSASANAVVAEIRAAGGEAVANGDSVMTPAGAAAMVKTALDAFGRLDIVVNNAGFLRDRSYAKMTIDEIQAVIGVHLLGPMYVTHAAWPAMKAQGYGRVIMVSSTSGLYGNFGQANYGAAKLGVVGFMNGLKEEGVRSGILVNTVAPLALTRASEEAFDPASHETMRIDWIVALVCYLASESCAASGELIHAGAGKYARARIAESLGVSFAPDTEIKPELVAARFAEIEGAPARYYDNAASAVLEKGIKPAVR